MPQRNLVTIFLVSIISVFCYQRANLNRYGDGLAQAMNIVDAQYVRSVTHRQLYENAMHGMVESLDQYSSYISPSVYGQFVEGLDQEFGGVGILVEEDETTGRLRVTLPLPDTPAYRAGLLPDDLIVSIDGQDTLGMGLADAIELMRGRPSEIVRLGILHAGESEPVELNVERAAIPIESVKGDLRRRDGTWDFRLQTDPRITYIRLETFGERTLDELNAAFEGADLKALILDLRGNAGGLLKAAIAICDLFIERGGIVSTRGRGDQVVDAYQATIDIGFDRDIPVAVLIDHESASASEIVAACLQDHGRAVVVGTRSWGKGTVQNVIPMEGGTAALKLTIATYWRPSGKDIHRSLDEGDDDPWGVTPDEGYLVVVDGEERERVRVQRSQRDLPESEFRATGDQEEPVEDRQLQKAITYLETQLDGYAAD